MKMRFKVIIALFLVILITILISTDIFITRDGFTVNDDDEYEDEEYAGIPMIIHQTAPTDKTKWPNVWFKCQKTWKTHFPEPKYHYIMWTDQDLDNLIKIHFPKFYKVFTGYNKKIKRIDIARYFILYKYGGIYADMDYECFTNFYNEVPSDMVSISESPYKENEHLQNALMISPAKHPFWLKVIEKAKERFDTTNDVLYETGPVLITDTYNENKNMVNVLPVDKWNPHKNGPVFMGVDLITRHHGTITW